MEKIKQIMTEAVRKESRANHVLNAIVSYSAFVLLILTIVKWLPPFSNSSPSHLTIVKINDMDMEYGKNASLKSLECNILTISLNQVTTKKIYDIITQDCYTV